MTSLVNRYFNKTPKNEQALVQGLVTEAIQVQGITCHYLPRKLQNLDMIFGEDPTSKFTAALPIEFYIETSAGWDGQSELIEKFGLEIRNKITFSVSVSRWDSEVKKIKADMWVSTRPQEGDLIYDSITKKLFEIKFLDQDHNFYQLGKMTYMYRMQCEMFQYSQETITSGITDLDTAVAAKNQNQIDHQLLMEDFAGLLQENGGPLIVEHQSTYDSTSSFKQKAVSIGWDANNPFADH